VPNVDRKVQLVPKFKEYDHDKNGYITLDEATRILQNPPYSFPAGRVGMLLKKFDKDGNGKLDIEEFADFYAEAKATYAFQLTLSCLCAYNCVTISVKFYLFIYIYS